MGNVNSEIARIEQAKDNIEAAIENCGVDVPDTELISDYATYINKIPEAVFAQFQLAKQGGTDEYIESIAQTNGTISVTTGGLASTDESGLMSKEDKTRLDLLAAQSIPIIFGNNTDTTKVWTGSSDSISSYLEGMSIIFVPKKQGSSDTTLAINSLDALPLVLKGGISSLLADTPTQLTLINNEWVVFDKDTTYTMPYGLYVWFSHNSGVLVFKNTGPLQNLIDKQRSLYFLLIMTINYTCVRSVEYIAIGNVLTGKLPLKVDGKTLVEGDVFLKGQYIAYWDGEYCYINTDGTIPGKINKASIADTVEWNEVEGDNEDVSIGESSVTNSLYLYAHNLTHLSKKPSEYKNQYLTAWFSNTDMPLTQTCSGINISSSSTKVNWQLCSLASNTYDSAYDRLWFRSGLGESWNSWQRVAFTNDLLTHGMGMILSAGEDVNSLSTGIYSVENEDVASKIVNAPVDDSGFKLFTLAGYQSPTSYGSQLAFSKDNFYWRLLGQNNQECSDWYSWLKIKKGESVGTPNTPMYIDEVGMPRAINCSIEKSVPANAQFTDTRCMSLNMPLKTEAESISDEDEVVGVLKAEAISASGDGTYLSGLLSYVNVPTENFVKRAFKVKQEPVEDPTADGTSTTFIDSISLDENGKITVTKKTILNTGGTSQSIPVASETDLGGIRLGYTTDLASRNYKVLVNLYGDAYVNVPWVPGESGDTKNTAGATNSELDLFIIGSLDQSDNPQTYSNANIKISGNAIKASGGFYQESDERLKDFKDDILVDLEQLSKLPKKKFTWKNDYTKETHIGTSAQEVQKLYPELVKEDSDGTLSVAYDKLSIIALKAIDELYQRNIELEKRIQELENK